MVRRHCNCEEICIYREDLVALTDRVTLFGSSPTILRIHRVDLISIVHQRSKSETTSNVIQWRWWAFHSTSIKWGAGAYDHNLCGCIQVNMSVVRFLLQTLILRVCNKSYYRHVTVDARGHGCDVPECASMLCFFYIVEVWWKVKHWWTCWHHKGAYRVLLSALLIAGIGADQCWSEVPTRAPPRWLALVS